MILSKKRVNIVVMALIQCLLCFSIFAQDVSGAIELTESELDELIERQVYPYSDSDWKAKDIGKVNVQGTASGQKRWIIVGGAGSGIQGKNDSFHFLYQEIKGDFTIEIDYVRASYSDEPNLKAGIMVRESLYSDSAYLGMFMVKDSSSGEPVYSSQIQMRKAWKNNTKTVAIKEDKSMENSELRAFRINRTGDKVTCYTSKDGSEWIQEGDPAVIEIGKTAYVGLCVTSENPKELAHADFAGVRIIQNNDSIYRKPWESGSNTKKTKLLVNLAVGKEICNDIEKSAFMKKFISQNAIDGDDSTKWSVDGLGQSLEVDLGDIYEVHSFEMLISSSEAYRYTIEASDGYGYVEVVNNTKNTYKKKLFKENIKLINARYIKLTINGIYSSSSIRLNVNEFRVLGIDEPKEVIRTPIYETGFMDMDLDSFGWNMTGCKKVYLGYKNWAAELGAKAELSKTISTEGYTNIILTVGRWVKRCEGKESFIIEWYDGKRWETLEKITGNEREDSVSFLLPESASNNKKLKIRFRTENYDSDDFAYLRYIELYGTPIE